MAFDSLTNRLNKVIRDVSGKGKLTDKNMEDMLREVRVALLEADVNYKIAKEFLDHVREKARGEDVLNGVQPGEMLVKIIHDEIIELLGTDAAGLNFREEGLTSIMVVGLQGTGKTTSTAKIARLVKHKFGRKPLLIAADVIRPAAIEQLQTLGSEIGVEVFTRGTETDAYETVRQGMEYARENGFDTVFIDTAGRLHIDEDLMQELADIEALVHCDEILLTVDAMTGQDIIHVAEAFSEALPLTGLIVTKFDGDSRGGGVLSVRKITDVPVKFVGEGEKIDEMDLFYPDRMADRILGMGDVVSLVEKVQDSIDLEAAEKAAERMLNGQFSLDDLLAQMEQMAKMGPLGNIMKMLPGYSQYADMIDTNKANDGMKRTKAIIQSMTKFEREHPEKLRGTMKKRIAKGSGTTVTEINRLITQYEKTKKVMDHMGTLQRTGKLNEETMQKMMEQAQKQTPQMIRVGNKKNPFKF